MSSKSHTRVGGCPDASTVVKEIVFATYGGREGECSEGFEGLIETESCRVPSAKATVEKACLGKLECSFKPTNEYFGVDPCPNQQKAARVVARCGK